MSAAHRRLDCGILCALVFLAKCFERLSRFPDDELSTPALANLIKARNNVRAAIRDLKAVRLSLVDTPESKRHHRAA